MDNVSFNGTRISFSFSQLEMQQNIFPLRRSMIYRTDSPITE